MMCREIHELLIEYHENSLDPEQKAKVEGHLDSCENCRLRLQEVRQVYGMLAEDSVPPAEENFWIDFLPQVRSRIEAKRRPAWNLWPRARWAVGVVSVLALVIVGSLLLTGKDVSLVQEETEQPEETALALYGPYSYADQLVDVISSDSTKSYPTKLLLAEGGVEDLGLAEEVLQENYVREADVDLILSELSLEELRLLEENVKSIQVKDIL